MKKRELAFEQVPFLHIFFFLEELGFKNKS